MFADLNAQGLKNNFLSGLMLVVRINSTTVPPMWQP